MKHDRRFAGNEAFNNVGIRFYAAAPIRDKAGQVLGVLCLTDTNPRELDSREMRLLQAMANDVMEEWKGIDLPDPEIAATANSATVGQVVPR